MVFRRDAGHLVSKLLQVGTLRICRHTAAMQQGDCVRHAGNKRADGKAKSAYIHFLEVGLGETFA